MPLGAFLLAALRRTRAPDVSRPRGAWLGYGLSVLGIVLLAIAAAPLIAGAQSQPVCKADGTDKGKCLFEPEDEEGVPLASLKSVEKPIDPQLASGGRFIKNQTALEQLGKAFFWDQQVGSDGQACGSCHFVAGADSRTRNQASPGLKATPVDITFQNRLGPNHTISASDFPFHKLADPNNRNSTLLRDSNDVWSSAGVLNRQFVRIQSNVVPNDQQPFDFAAMDVCTSTLDADGFRVGNINVRRAEPRNTPTMINAMFNNRNFWDSRAQDIFNGVNPFGKRDPGAVVFDRSTSEFPRGVGITINHASLQSQAVGPPTNPNEMSCNGRTFPDVGHKLLTSTTTPLAQQDVAANDSLLGSIAVNRASGGRTTEGLTRSYRQMVQDAFQSRWWSSDTLVAGNGVGPRPQIEANFSLFWGLAVGAYMETLLADDSEIDRFFDGREQLSQSELRGLLLFSSGFGTRPSPIRNPTARQELFLADGKTPADLRCTACHGGPEMTAASIDAVTEDARLERMAQLPVDVRGQDVPRCAIYDAGHFHTGVRPVNDDRSLGFSGGVAGSEAPLAETDLALAGLLAQLVPSSTAPFGLQPALNQTLNCDEGNTQGTFKAPSLRNIELTGPYFHNGGELTLRQVIDFYNRGGNFQDNREFDPNVHNLNLGQQDKDDLVSFLLALTDPRVAFERAPFDHPSICVSNGSPGNESSTQAGNPLPGDGPAARAAFLVECHQASGANGLQNRLQPFLGANQRSP
jgi:cytochrome c peroxidase